MKLTNIAQDPVHTQNHRETAFADWLVNAPPGERFIYHVGHLITDRTHARDETRETATSIAELAWRLYETGLVHLYQQRVSNGVFRYIAEARPDPRRKRR